MLRGLLALALCAAAAGCGGSPAGSSSTQIRPVAQPKRQCQGSKLVAARDHQPKALQADLRRLRAAAATVKRYTQKGNAAITNALDRFLLDVAKESLPVHERSRFIEHAAAVAAPHCDLCFPALEANGPIDDG